jgi:hypothetical protein
MCLPVFEPSLESYRYTSLLSLTNQNALFKQSLGNNLEGRYLCLIGVLSKDIFGLNKTTKISAGIAEIRIEYIPDKS